MGRKRRIFALAPDPGKRVAQKESVVKHKVNMHDIDRGLQQGRGTVEIPHRQVVTIGIFGSIFFVIAAVGETSWR